PILPLELEREIFEITARLYPWMVRTLLRVAHRVLGWIEPMIYETLIVNQKALHPSFLLALKTKPAGFLHVRNLLLGTQLLLAPDELNMLLSACSAVVNLALFRPHHSMLPHLAAMKLQRLRAELYSLFNSVVIDFTHPLFTAVTHLDTRDWGSVPRYSDPSGFASLPALTHLNICNASCAVLCSLLLGCKKLKVLILSTYSLQSCKNASRNLSIDDPRFVLMTYGGGGMVDWEAGTRGERDYWERADLFVAKRRRGEIRPGACPTVLQDLRRN
ncbi:hypothetical protein FB451DRAFT_1024520, partial [Mycena latifolia]